MIDEFLLLFSRWDTNILSSLPLVAGAYCIWLGAFYLRVIRPRRSRFEVLTVRADTWSRYLAAVLGVMGTNFLASFFASTARLHLLKVDFGRAYVLGMVRGGAEGALFGLYSLMIFSSFFSVSLGLLEAIAHAQSRRIKNPVNLSSASKYAIGHTFACIAGFLVTPVGTVVWVVQDNVFSQAGIDAAYRYEIEGLARVWITGALLGANFGFLSWYVKRICAKLLDVADIDSRIRAAGVVIGVALILLTIGLGYYHVAHSRTFLWQVFNDPATQTFFRIWTVFWLLFVGGAMIGMSLLERGVDLARRSTRTRANAGRAG